MEYRCFVQNMVETYLNHLSKKAIFIKHYNTLDITLYEILHNVNCEKSHSFLFHEYAMGEMKSSYEPFLLWAKTCYETFYQKQLTVEEFIDACGVYPLHREIISTYIKTGVCCRSEEILMEEYNYEKERMLLSLYSVFEYVAKEHSLVMVISKLHMASLSTLKFINYAFHKEENIHFVFTYNDVFQVREYVREEWEKLIHIAQNCHMILEWGKLESKQSIDLQDDFLYREEQVQNYISIARNMYFTLTFEDATYYLGIIYDRVNSTDSQVSKENRLKISALYALSMLGLNNKNQALFICENMLPLIGEEDFFFAYVYNYLSALAHLMMLESGLTYKFCTQCRKYAQIMGDEVLKFRLDIVECVARFGSFREVFRCNYNYAVSEELVEKTKRFGYDNFLAYLYIFGYDNDEQSIIDIATGKKEAVYFNKGIEIAKRLGNTNLQMTAYMKNIIIYSEYGFHGYVRTMYEKRIAVADKKNQVERARMYGGIGYNCIVLESYEEADRYFRNSLLILMTHEKVEDIAEIMYNMALNYFVAEINDRASECVECTIKIMDCIRIQNLRICNTSKLYGIMALANYKMGQYYNCYYCLNKMEAILRHILNQGEHADFRMWEEDLFLYYLAKAVMYAYEKDMENAEYDFRKAYFFMNQLEGVKFYTYTEYAVLRSRFLKEERRQEESQEILLEAYQYCIEHGHDYKAEQLKAEMSDTVFMVENRYSKKEIPFDEILRIAVYTGIRVKLESRERELNFLTVYQELLIKEQDNTERVITTALNLIQNSFNLDKILVLEKTDAGFDMRYSNSPLLLNQESIQNIFAFFIHNPKEFLVNRVDKNFQKYMPVIEVFGENSIVSIIGIPVIWGGSVVKIFLGTVDIHRNFTTNRQFLSSDSLMLLKFAVRQLDETVKRIENAKTIEAMNEELEKSVVTDRLTGIYNRFGYDRIVKNLKGEKGVVLYMDLDNFKYYNDHFGHHVGDEILIRFADILKQVVGRKGYAIRYGGDEFVILIPDQGEDYAVKLVKRIMRQLETQLKQSVHRELENAQGIEKDKEITCSMGIAAYQGNHYQDVELSLKRADAALYHIKRRVKGQYALWSSLKQETEQEEA